jgi:hypothetical protein
VPTIAFLDYAFRFLHLKPLSCISFKPKRKKVFHLTRVCIPCESTDRALPSHRDTWMQDTHPHFKKIVDWPFLNKNLTSVAFSSEKKDMIYHKDTQSVNLFKTVKARTNKNHAKYSRDWVKSTLDSIY